LKPWALRVSFYPYDQELYHLPANLLLNKFVSKKKAVLKEFSNKEDVYLKIMKHEYPFDDESSELSSVQHFCKNSEAQKKEISLFVKSYRFSKLQEIDWLEVRRDAMQNTNLKLSALDIYKVFIQ